MLLLLVAVSPAWAEPVAGGGDLFIPWIKMIVALLLVLGLILLLYYGASRKGFGLLPAARGGRIKVLEMRSLGPKKGVCLIRVGDEEYLLGLGGDRVELLARLAEPKTTFAAPLDKQPGESA